LAGILYCGRKWVSSTPLRMLSRKSKHCGIWHILCRRTKTPGIRASRPRYEFAVPRGKVCCVIVLG